MYTESSRTFPKESGSGEERSVWGRLRMTEGRSAGRGKSKIKPRKQENPEALLKRGNQGKARRVKSNSAKR